MPDTASTGQILRELAEGLLDHFEITVICVVPSYIGIIEDKYKTQKHYIENINGVNVIRVRVPEFQKGNKLSRIKNILTYFIRSLLVTWKVDKQDFILAVSQPPILGGLLGVWGKWVNKVKYKNLSYLVYQIQDFNPEQIEAVGYFKFKSLLYLLRKIDKYSCKKADLVITVGRDLVETVENRFKKDYINMPKVALINNWIDEKEIHPLSPNNEQVIAFKEKYGLKNKFIICYSGNLGHYYDLMNLLKVIEKFDSKTTINDGREVIFTFIGAGSLLNSMKEYVRVQHMTNVLFIPYQDKSELIFSLNAADVHWCVNAKGIKGVSCPSKYYGIAAVGKPVLGVLEKGSEIRRIVEETNGGLCCDPGEYEVIEKNISWFIENADSNQVKEMGIRSREYLAKNLTREKSVARYAEMIMGLEK